MQFFASSSAANLGKPGVEIGVAGPVEAGHALLGPERLVEGLAQALLAHVQTGGQPSGLEIRAQQVLELGPEDRAGDEPGHCLPRRERAKG